MKILDLGCGKNKVPGAVGIDVNDSSDADIIHDLNKFPYPFESDIFDEIVCNQILEHVEDVFLVMEELYRIAKPEARLRVWVPHFSSADAYGDPSHKRAFSSRSFDYFTSNYPELEFYSKVRIEKITTRISFWSLPKLGGLKPQHIIGASLLANKLPTVYERFFAWMLPAQTLYFEFQVIK